MLDRFSHFADWVVEHGAGNSWGIVLQSDKEAEVIYRHLRKFLIVTTEEGKELYFRFYDPRVLRVFLPTCDTEQLLEFFGPVEAFILEDEEGSMLQFQLNGTELEVFNLDVDLKVWMNVDSPPVPKLKVDDSAVGKKNLPPENFNSLWDFSH
jgi:hypothetical protein